MKTKTLQWIIGVCLLLGTANVANGQVKYYEANDYFQEELYFKAIPLFEKAYAKKPSAVCAAKLGHCYYELRNIESAIIWFEKATTFNDYDPSIHFLLGELYKQIGAYDKASVSFDLYGNSDALSMDKARQYANACDSLLEGIPEKSSVSIVSVDNLNTEFDEFSPTEYQESMVFSSDRYSPAERINKRRNPQTGTAFLSMYIAPKGNHVEEPEPLWEKSVFDHHEGTKSFTVNNEIYYTSVSKDGDHAGLLQIVKAKVQDNEIVEKELFEHNVLDASDAHPCVSADGQRLYFVSNRGNGYGGTDIYVCDRTENGWSAPRNLGPGVNSAYDEVFPFEQADNCLYFSSNRPSSLGGLDFYRAVRTSGLWQPALNMGAPLNSNRDDFGIVFLTESNDGYFSSNRSGGKGGDDLYAFETNEAFQRELNRQFSPKDKRADSERFAKNENAIKSGNSNASEQPIVGTLEVKELELRENPDGAGYIVMGKVEENYDNGEVQAADNAELKIYDKSTGQRLDSYTDASGGFQFEPQAQKAPGAYDIAGRPLFIPESEQKTQPNGNPHEALAYDENGRPLYYYDRSDLALLNAAKNGKSAGMSESADRNMQPIEPIFSEAGAEIDLETVRLTSEPTGREVEQIAYRAEGTPVYFYTPKSSGTNGQSSSQDAAPKEKWSDSHQAYDENGTEIDIPLAERFKKPTGASNERVGYDNEGNPMFFYVPGSEAQALAFDEKGNRVFVPDSSQHQRPQGNPSEKVAYDVDGRPLFFYTPNAPNKTLVYDENGNAIEVPKSQQRQRPNGSPEERVAYDANGRPLFFYSDPTQAQLAADPLASKSAQIQGGNDAARSNTGTNPLVYSETGEALVVPALNQRRQPSSAMEEKIAYDAKGQPLFYYFSQDAQPSPQNSIANFEQQLQPKVNNDPRNYAIQTSKPGFFTKNMNILADPSSKSVKVLSENELLININYDYNDAKILPESEVILNQLVNYLHRNPHLQINLRSYCDVRGSDTYNLQLSKRRAESVKTYLILNGIDYRRIESIGLGESDPILPFARTDAEHHVNRRTEFTFLEMP